MKTDNDDNNLCQATPEKTTSSVTHCLYHHPQKRSSTPQQVQDPRITHSFANIYLQPVAVTGDTRSDKPLLTWTYVLLERERETRTNLLVMSGTHKCHEKQSRGRSENEVADNL